MKRVLSTAMLALMMSVCAQAALITFDFTTLSLVGDPLNISQATSEAGVNFNADLALDGSGTILTDGNGLAVLGGTSFEINAGESILFTGSTSASSGGLGVFDGFQSISFTEFESGDSGLVNGIAVSSNSTVDLAGASTINLSGTGDSPLPTSGFQVTQVVANFSAIPTATGVPEPGSFAALLLMGGCVVARRRRRKSA